MGGLSLADALLLCELLAKTIPLDTNARHCDGCSASSTSGCPRSPRLRWRRQRQRSYVLAPAVKAADLELTKLGILPIGHVTFHGLRRSFASLRSYGGKPHRETADLLGHEDVRFTLNVYSQSGLDPEEMLPPVRQAFERALDWAGMGSGEPLTV